MDFFEVVHSQRSIRRFKPDPVPEEALWNMLDAAIRGPSGNNSQPWIWLVARDQAKREAIARAVRERVGDRVRQLAEKEEDPSHRRTLLGAAGFFDDVAKAPVLIIPCLYGVTSPSDDPHTLLAGSSIYGAVQNLMLAARAQGLGTVLTTIQPGIDDILRQQFHLPDDAVPACIVPVGYPDGQRFGPTNRRPVETVSYWDDWGAARSRA